MRENISMEIIGIRISKLLSICQTLKSRFKASELGKPNISAGGVRIIS
jgi:hypothetical protein